MIIVKIIYSNVEEWKVSVYGTKTQIRPVFMDFTKQVVPTKHVV